MVENSFNFSNVRWDRIRCSGSSLFTVVYSQMLKYSDLKPFQILRSSSRMELNAWTSFWNLFPERSSLAQASSLKNLHPSSLKFPRKVFPLRSYKLSSWIQIECFNLNPATLQLSFTRFFNESLKTFKLNVSTWKLFTWEVTTCHLVR